MDFEKFSDQKVDEMAYAALSAFKDFVEERPETSFERAFQEAEHHFMLFTKEIWSTPVSKELSFLQSFDAWGRAKEPLRKTCQDFYLTVQKEYRVRQIRSTLVDSFIIPLLRDAGYPYRVEWQKNRIKVMLLLEDYRHVFTFYVKYRDLQNEAVIDRIPEVLKTVRLLKDFGPQISITTKGRHDGDWTFPGSDDCPV